MAAKKKSAKKKSAKKKPSAAKSSLVENINKRKRAGTSRPPARSTISREAYDAMEKGWPRKKKKKAAAKKNPR